MLVEQLFVVQHFVTASTLSPPILAEEPPTVNAAALALLVLLGQDMLQALQSIPRGWCKERSTGTCSWHEHLLHFGGGCLYAPSQFHRYGPGLTKRCQSYDVPDVVLRVPCLGLSQSPQSLHILYLRLGPSPALWSSVQFLSHRQVTFVGISWNLKDFSALYLTKLT